MPTRLTTTLSKIGTVPNAASDFHRYMKSNAASEHHRNNSLKVVIAFRKHLGADIALSDVQHREHLFALLDTEIRSEDPEKRWMTTWDDALRRLKMFYGWLYNARLKAQEQFDVPRDWQTPAFLKIKEKHSKKTEHKWQRVIPWGNSNLA
jgi:hypothetical protein